MVSKWMIAGAGPAAHGLRVHRLAGQGQASLDICSGAGMGFRIGFPIEAE